MLLQLLAFWLQRVCQLQTAKQFAAWTVSQADGQMVGCNSLSVSICATVCPAVLSRDSRAAARPKEAQSTAPVHTASPESDDNRVPAQQQHLHAEGPLANMCVLLSRNDT